MSYLKPAFSNLLTCNVLSQNKKTLDLRPKILSLAIFGLDLIETIIKFLINTLEFVAINFRPKRKKKNLRQKKLYLGPWTGMLNNYCHICNQSPPIYLISKFYAKIRILKFGTENALFR